MDDPPPTPEAEPAALPAGGQQQPPHTIPNILLADLSGYEHPAHGSVVLTSTQRGVWGCVVGGLEDADREELRKVCKTTAAIEHAMAWLPRWIEVVLPEEEEEEESDEDQGSKDEDEDVELDEEDEDAEAEDENEEVDAGGPPGATLLGGIATTLEDALAAFKRFRAREPTRRFEIRLGEGAHETGFLLAADEDGDQDPGFVGGGDFRGLNLEGGGWDGLRIKTPEVCAVYG